MAKFNQTTFSTNLYFMIQMSGYGGKASSGTISLSLAVGPFTVTVSGAIITEICHSWSDQATTATSHRYADL